jgi:hypothetical protein
MLKLGYVSRARSCHVILPWARQINLSSTLVRALPNLSSKLGHTHSKLSFNRAHFNQYSTIGTLSYQSSNVPRT